MTAPDDLARLIAAHRLVLRGPHAGTCYICGPVSDYYEHLASVVSRRDADPQAKAWDEGYKAGSKHATESIRYRDSLNVGPDHTPMPDRARNPYRSRRPADTDTGRGQ